MTITNFTKDKRKLITNFFSLSSVEVANYLFPLITLPYLVRVLGVEKFGLIAFAQAFVQYFVLLTDYGFNLSANRNVSIHRNDIEKVSRIFSSVMLIKFCLMLLSFMILSALVFSIPKFRADWGLYYCCFAFVISNILFPIWLFQGMEKMKLIAFLNLIAKTIFLVAVFVFVKKQGDYFYVPLLAAIGGITTGILSIAIAVKRFHVRLKLVSVVDIADEFKDGWHIFISTAAISLYTTSNTFILGLFTNNTIVGYYSAAERIIKSGQKLLNPISQTIYPHISKLVADSKERAVHFIKKALFIIGGGSFAISLSIFVLSGPIVRLLLGAQFTESITVLRILAFLPFIIALSNIFGIQTMITFNMKEAFSRILIAAGFINIPLALILVPFFKHIGLAVAVLTTESFVTLTMFLYLHKKGILKAGYVHGKI
ncbi:MAG: flippase [Candidatus Omnitrophota bacterium]